MKIAISSRGPELDSEVEPRFGRSPYYIIYDTESKSFEAIRNPAVNAPSGAGIQATQLVAQKGVKYVLTGNVGPNAFSVLTSSGIRVITGVGGKVQEAIDRFLKGELKEMGAFAPQPGAYPGAYPPPGPYPPSGVYPRSTSTGSTRDTTSEIKALKEHLSRLKEQIEMLLSRLEELEKGVRK